MRLLFSGWPTLDHYQAEKPGCEGVWLAGEERTVPPETASYLLETHPMAFSPVEPTDRMMRPPVARATTGPANDALGLSVAKLRDALGSGAYDSVLDTLRAAEVAGANRATALAAIDARIAHVSTEG